MKAIVLAGGFAKRLRPLSDDTPKPLLQVGGRPMIDHIIDKISEIGVNEIIISTNQKFKTNFEQWLLLHKNRLNTDIIAESATREEEKPGAAAALAQISPMIKDDCLIIAGDNLFTASLGPLANLFQLKHEPVIGVYDVKDTTLAKQYSNVALDGDSRVIEFIEKPSNPKTTLIATCIYFLPERILPLLQEFISVKGDHDSPGRFIQWLYQVQPVYAMKIPGSWWDIGTLDQYAQVNQIWKSRGKSAFVGTGVQLPLPLTR